MRSEIISSIKEKLFFIPTRNERVIELEQIQLISFYFISLLILILFPMEAVKVFRDGNIFLTLVTSLVIILNIISLLLFWKTRNIVYSQRIIALIILIVMFLSIWSGGGKYGLSSLYFLASFSIFFLILDYITGIILPLIFFIGMTLRLKMGAFESDSIFSSEIVRDRFILVLFLAVLFGIFGSISVKILVNHLSKLAFYDKITGLPKGERFTHSFRSIVLQNKKENNALTLIGIKVQHIERINANLGSEKGNAILKEISDRLLLESFILTARWSGSIFMALIASDEFTKIKKRVEELKEKLEEPYLNNGEMRTVQFIIALSRYPEDGDDTELVQKNVLTLLEGKSIKSGDLIFFDEEKLKLEQFRFSLNEALNRSSFSKEFRLVYQAKVRLRDKSCIGAEVLLRWNSENIGAISPEDFIPIAEESGKIRMITRWVIENTFKDISEINETGDKLYKELIFAINLSVIDLKDPGLIPFIEANVKKYSMTPGLIEFEVTESIQADDDPQIQTTLSTLMRLGFRLGIDDFGTGYSSLSHLHRLHVNNLKIDKSFIQLIHSDTSQKTYPVIDAIISMGLSLELDITAEGIETEKQYHYLTEKGCSHAQGWLFSKALPFKEFLVYLKA